MSFFISWADEYFISAFYSFSNWSVLDDPRSQEKEVVMTKYRISAWTIRILNFNTYEYIHSYTDRDELNISHIHHLTLCNSERKLYGHYAGVCVSLCMYSTHLLLYSFVTSQQSSFEVKRKANETVSSSISLFVAATYSTKATTENFELIQIY